MNEVEVSPAVKAAAQVAGSEAVDTKHKEISVGLMLIGLCKLDTVDLPEQEQHKVKAECDRLDLLFSSCGIDRMKLGQKIKQLEGEGSYPHPEPEVVNLAPECKEVVKQAKKLAKDYQQPVADSYVLLLAMVGTEDPTVKQAFGDLGVDIDAFRQAIVSELEKPTPEPEPPPEEEVERALTPILDELGVDLIQLAKEGKIRPIINRKDELRQMLVTLMREEQNNPILIGEAGVGKSVIIKGLAYRINEGNVIPFLKNKRVVQIDISSITGRGDPRGKLREIIDEVKSAPDVIIFIDEIHTLAEQGVSIRYGLADVLKPALAAGEFPLIGATTTEEYRKYFQEDAAFARRFQPITVSEPSAEVTREILEAAKKPWEKTLYVHVSPEAIKAAINLTIRYMPSQRLPDKAKKVLEDACIKTHLGKSKVSLTPGVQTGPENIGKVTEYSIAETVSKWTGILDVDTQISEAEKQRFGAMAEMLKRRVIGQDEAVDAIVDAIVIARTGIKDHKRPTGVFLFVGPSGVGKTQLAKSLAKFLFHSEDALARLDMAEYQQEHEVSRIKGPPPGYVGYEKGGDLTNKLLDRPYSVVLLDEIEKAHPNVYEVLLALFSDGRLTDNHFRVADGRNAIFIMTSNIGSELYREKRIIGPPPSGAKRGPVVLPWAELDKRIRRRFSPEFLGRCDETIRNKEESYPFIMFKPLTRENTVEIARIAAGELAERLTEQNVTLEFDDSAIHLLAEEGFSPAYGARQLQNVLRRLVATPLSYELLHSNVKPGDKVVVKAEEGKFTFETEKGTPEATPTGE